MHYSFASVALISISVIVWYGTSLIPRIIYKMQLTIMFHPPITKLIQSTMHEQLKQLELYEQMSVLPNFQFQIWRPVT